MDKLKKNAGIKFAAAIVLSVTILGMLASGLLGYWLFEEGAYEPGGKQSYQESVLYDVMSVYEDEVLYSYADCYVYNSIDPVVYKEREEKNFKEENSNYFYKIEPLDKENSQYPTVSNYYTNDYRYSYTDVRQIDLDNQKFVFMYKYPEQIADMMDEYNGYTTYSDEEYEEDLQQEDLQQEDIDLEDTSNINNTSNTSNRDNTNNINNTNNTDSTNDAKYKEEIDNKFNEIYIKYLRDSGYQFAIHVNDSYRFDFESDFGFRESVVKFFEGNNLEKYNSFEIISACTDEEKHRTEYTISCSNSVDFLITNYVKNDLTASDNFTRGYAYLALRGLADWVVAIFIACAILALILAVFLINSAGHNKQSEEIKENAFDRIPYDLVLVIPLFLFAGIAELFCDSDLEGMVILSGIFALITPFLITTTATRLKVGNIFKNTITYRLIKLLIALLNKINAVLKYLYSNANLYIRYIGIFGVISVIEFFFIMATDSGVGGVGFLWLVEKIAIIGILAVALINMSNLKNGAKEIAEGNSEHKIDTEKMLPSFKEHGNNLNRIQDGIAVAVEERMKSERMKTELITNVSHDIKTPLTSLISYVDLLKKENIENEKANEYIEVLDRQSAKLKKLIQDLIDASKASTGNLSVDMAKMDLKVMLEQVSGEFEEKLSSRNLKLNTKYCDDDIAIMADGKHLWRALDNIFINVYKYAQENTRVYIDVDYDNSGSSDNSQPQNDMVNISFKNISKEELNISGAELMERFVRGDSSRNTEGSGLGLSIAKSLVEIQGGKMEIIVDGDLFKVVLSLHRVN